MNIQQSLLQEFEREMASTRKSLERVPEKLDWKPHPKSMSMGQLAGHLAEIPDWAEKTIQTEELDLAPAAGPPQAPKSSNEILAKFDKNYAAARTALANTNDDDLMKTWTFKAGGRTIFTMPRVAVLRGFILNHTIHHRAQLGVYLRLNDVPVPAIYGPSADEGSM